jgi:glucose/mannose-6-phosphate isomerase
MSAIDVTGVDETRLDDIAVLEAGDPAGMLRDVATAGAQLRAARTRAQEADLDRLTVAGRPRAVVVAGMGGSGISGDVLAAVAGPGCPIPVITHRGFGLPGWVGASDLVAVVSCSGTTAETVSAAEDAVRRGCRLVGVGGADSPLADLVERARSPYVSVPSGAQPRAMLWALTAPLLVLADALELLGPTPLGVESAANLLDEVAQRCRPTSETFVNPAKLLAVQLAGTLPLVWGSSPLAAVAAYRVSCQLAENAKYPSVVGAMPESLHNQVVGFDGPFAPVSDDEEDFFRDRVEDSTSTRLRLVLARDCVEDPRLAARRDAVSALAAERGIAISELLAEGTSPLDRLASLVAVGDFATVYLAIGLGIDPTPVGPITELKARVAG